MYHFVAFQERNTLTPHSHKLLSGVCVFSDLDIDCDIDIGLMLRDAHSSVQPHVECHKTFSMMWNPVILPFYNAAAVLLRTLGECVHARS